jgi:hypothetical protein
MKKIANQLSKPFLWLNMTGIMIILFLLFSGINFTLNGQNHLLISEITLQTDKAEFIEIFNPTNSAISLDDYYLADNQTYPNVSKGSLPVLDVGDFIVRFPGGSFINSMGLIVVARNGVDFENFYGKKADFEIYSQDVNTADMIIFDGNLPSLTNAGEGIALFYWNGSDAVVKDVDLMNAGVPSETSQIVDKSSIAGYLPDAHTMPVQGHKGPPEFGFSTKRILLEGQYEIHSGGNGITGDDETSEDISKTWDEVFKEPTPGNTELVVNGITPATISGMTMRIYPNPTSSEINMIINSQVGKYHIQILNFRGSVLENFTNIFDESFKINLSKFGNGIYFIVIQSDIEKCVQKVILVN